MPGNATQPETGGEHQHRRNHLQHPGFSQRLGELLAHYPAVSPRQIEHRGA
jgi:hypothetical protein